MRTATSRRWTPEAEAAPPVAYRVRRLDAIDDVDPRAWNQLAGTDSPFLRHEFLAALEHGGCVGRRKGWHPAHLLIEDESGLAAASPAYLREDSWGEFVFDFAWARAYEDAGLAYYPKLVLAVPFSPVTGKRLLLRPGADAALRGALITQAETLVQERALSSAHALFPDDDDLQAFIAAGWLPRRDCQFHWVNRGYASYEEYLSTFTAEKRKKAKRERRRVEEAGIRFLTLSGADLTPELLEVVYAFHESTFLRHGHHPYLSRGFFAEVARTMGEQLMVKLALQDERPVAASIFFWSKQTLYGRYWGALEDFHSLHFECCYHQGIEFCIEQGIQRFEPGTQGEHKISRGFAAAITGSAHYIADGRFRQAIARFLRQEGPAVDAYAAQVDLHTPFRKA
jgi:predicted N-acyltransferase